MPLILPYTPLQPIIQTGGPLPNATVGVPYNTTITAAGGFAPYTYAISSDTPNTGNWLTINSATGALGGVPTTVEVESVSVFATDSQGTPGPPATFSLTVQPSGSGSSAPQAMWAGYRDSSNLMFSWWPPADGSTPDFYNVYRNGVLICGTSGGNAVNVSGLQAGGVTPDIHFGGGALHQAWYCDIGQAANTTNTYTVTSVTAGVESAAGPALQMTTSPSTPGATQPTHPVDPATWIQPFQLPNPALGTTYLVTNTTTPTSQGVGTPGPGQTVTGCGLQGAFTLATNAGANTPDLYVVTAGATFTAPAGQYNLPKYAANGGWAYVISSEEPTYKPGGKLPAYSVSQSKPGFSPFALSAPLAVNATSATLSSNWSGRTARLRTKFFDASTGVGYRRYAIYTNGSTAVTWNTNYPLPAACTATIGVQTTNAVTPTDIAAAMPTLLNCTATSSVGLQIQGLTNNVRFVGINFAPTPGLPSNLNQSLIQFLHTTSNGGNGPISTVAPAESIYFDRCIVGQDFANFTFNNAQWSNAMHGIVGINCNHFLASQCYFWGLTAPPGVDGDSYAMEFAGGSFHCMQNNHIEAGSEGVVYGGLYIAQQYHPSQIVYRWNWNTKPEEMAGTLLANVIKNHLEIKVGEFIEAYSNFHESTWSSAEAGQFRSFSVNVIDQIQGSNPLFQSPWNHVTNYHCHDNDIDGVQGAMECGNPSENPANYQYLIKYSNNRCYINPIAPQGSGNFFFWAFENSGSVPDYTVDHNTVIFNNASTFVSDGHPSCVINQNGTLGSSVGSATHPLPYTPNPRPFQIDRGQITNNIFDGNAAVSVQAGNGLTTTYGGTAVNKAFNASTLVFSANLMINDSTTGYPAGTVQNVGYGGVGFVNFTSNLVLPLPSSNWNLAPSSPYFSAGTDGQPLGAQI